MIQKQPGIQIVCQIYPKLQSSFFYHKKFFLAAKFLILTLSSGFALALAEKNTFVRNLDGLADYGNTGFKPGRMLFVRHVVMTLIFCEVDFISIHLNTKRKLGKIMIVHTITGHILLSCLFADMSKDFDQPVTEHDHFFFTHFSGLMAGDRIYSTACFFLN